MTNQSSNIIISGMHHCRFVTKSRKRDKYALVYAYFIAVANAKRPSYMSELTGRKIMARTWDSFYGQSNPVHVPNKYIRKTLPR